MYTHDVATFYHELSHSLHERIGLIRKGRSNEDRRDNEIVADICSAVLVRLYEGEDAGRQALQYVKSYDAKKTHLIKLLPEMIEVYLD